MSQEGNGDRTGTSHTQAVTPASAAPLLCARPGASHGPSRAASRWKSGDHVTEPPRALSTCVAEMGF